jgi:hypothetical protein
MSLACLIMKLATLVHNRCNRSFLILVLRAVLLLGAGGGQIKETHKEESEGQGK